MKKIDLERIRRNRRIWLPRIALFGGGLLFLCTVSLFWYLYPLFTVKKGESASSFVLGGEVEPPLGELSLGLRRLALGWFHSTTPYKKKMRVLILGFDQNDNKRPGRTDSMMVVEIHPKKGVGIVSIPRDLWVPIPKKLEVRGAVLHPTLRESEKEKSMSQEEFGRINTVYRLGDRRFGQGNGHRLLKFVLEEQLDLKVDHTIAVNYEGFQQIIDLLGGVEVDVQCPIRDNFISSGSPTGYELLEVAAGRQKLSGHQALLFMRSRHGRTDMDRSRRQQRVLLGLRERLLEDNNYWELPRIISKMMRHVKMDMDISVALRMAVSLKRLNRRLHGMVLSPPLVEQMKTPEQQSVLVLNAEKYTKKKKKLFSSALPGDRGKKVCPNIDVALNWRELKRKKPNSE